MGAGSLSLEEVPCGPGAQIFEEGHWVEAAGVSGAPGSRPCKCLK